MNILEILTTALADYIALSDPDKGMHITNLQYLILHIRNKSLISQKRVMHCTECLCKVPKSVLESVTYIMQMVNLQWTETYVLLAGCLVDEKKQLSYVLS